MVERAFLGKGRVGRLQLVRFGHRLNASVLECSNVTTPSAATLRMALIPYVSRCWLAPTTSLN